MLEKKEKGGSGTRKNLSGKRARIKPNRRLDREEGRREQVRVTKKKKRDARDRIEEISID